MKAAVYFADNFNPVKPPTDIQEADPLLYWKEVIEQAVRANAPRYIDSMQRVSCRGLVRGDGFSMMRYRLQGDGFDLEPRVVIFDEKRFPRPVVPFTLAEALLKGESSNFGHPYGDPMTVEGKKGLVIEVAPTFLLVMFEDGHLIHVPRPRATSLRH